MRFTSEKPVTVPLGAAREKSCLPARAAGLSVGPRPGYTVGLFRPRRKHSLIVPTLEPAFTAEAKLGAPIQIGPTYEGTRLDGVTQVEARYAIRTDDDVVIQVQNFGLRHGPAAVMQRLASGEVVDPTEFRFRGNPRFKAPEGKYEWLNQHMFIA